MAINGSIEGVKSEGGATLGTPFEIILPTPSFVPGQAGASLAILVTAEWFSAQAGALETGFILGRSDHYWVTNGTPSLQHVGDGLTGLSIAGGHTIEGGVQEQSDPISSQFGVAASVTAFAAGVATITGLTGMTSASVGNYLSITGADSSGNNSTPFFPPQEDGFPIVAFNSVTSVDIDNPNAVAGDANNGSISWQEHYGENLRLTVTHGGAGGTLRVHGKFNIRVKEIF